MTRVVEEVYKKLGFYLTAFGMGVTVMTFASEKFGSAADIAVEHERVSKLKIYADDQDKLLRAEQTSLRAEVLDQLKELKTDIREHNSTLMQILSRLPPKMAGK